MKCLRKDQAIENETIEELKLEKLVLQMNHPFMIGMKYVFQNQHRIYFIMEFVEGGELFSHLIKKPMKRFPEHEAKIMIA